MRQRRKDWTAALLSAALAVTLAGPAGMPGAQALEVHAAVTPGESISLGDGGSVSLDAPGKTVRVYGDAGTVYDVPIKVTADCSVLLDNIADTADLTVSDGVTANIIVRGTCSLGDIVAAGGVMTKVSIRGEDGQGTLTAGEVAQAGTQEPVSPAWDQEPETGASLDVEGCTLICESLGCGEDGRSWHGTLLGGDSTVCHATNGGHASPMVAVRDATLQVAGGIACGGSGVSEATADSHASSKGGRGGEVILAGSRVTVGGDVALGGAGGPGAVGSSQIEAGGAGSSGNVTILNGSIVEVTGNVGTQPDLAEESYGGTVNGLKGTTVVIRDSSLTCKDLASGGAGIGKTACREENGSVFYDGTDGGGGGELIAQNATVVCGTACNGADAGECCLPADVSDSHARHPADGMGGKITAVDSRITVKNTACRPGMRWEGFGGSQPLYNNSTFTGGTFAGGTLYGAVVTTDLTTIVSGDFSGKLDIRNAAGESAAKCVLNTAADMAGQTVDVTANAATGTALLNGSGQLVTYLAIGKNTVRVEGTDPYAGTFTVGQPEASNVFTLDKQKTDTGGDGTGSGGGSEGDRNTGSGSGTGSGGNGNAGTGSGGNGNAGTDSGSGTNTGGSGSGGSGGGAGVGGGSGGGAAAGGGSGSGATPGSGAGTGAGSGGSAGDSAGENTSGGAVSGGGVSGPGSSSTAEHAAKAPRIKIRSNVKGFRLLGASVKNTYQTYVPKTVRIRVLKETGCTYYYKVVEKGKHNRSVRWKKLPGDVVRVAASNTAKRVYLKAVGRNGKATVRKTVGFYVDNQKPTVKGVKNKAIYHRAVVLRFSDNIGIRSARLNGKKVKSGYRVSKNGTYRLSVTDRAGNKKTVLFTVRR